MRWPSPCFGCVAPSNLSFKFAVAITAAFTAAVTAAIARRWLAEVRVLIWTTNLNNPSSHSPATWNSISVSAAPSCRQPASPSATNYYFTGWTTPPR